MIYLFFVSGDSRHGLYNNSQAKRDFYESSGGRPVAAQCTKTQAIAITVFVLTAIFLTSLAASFARPFDGKKRKCKQ